MANNKQNTKKKKLLCLQFYNQHKNLIQIKELMTSLNLFWGEGVQIYSLRRRIQNTWKLQLQKKQIRFHYLCPIAQIIWGGGNGGCNNKEVDQGLDPLYYAKSHSRTRDMGRRRPWIPDWQMGRVFLRSSYLKKNRNQIFPILLDLKQKSTLLSPTRSPLIFF